MMRMSLSQLISTSKKIQMIISMTRHILTAGRTLFLSYFDKPIKLKLGIQNNASIQINVIIT